MKVRYLQHVPFEGPAYIADLFSGMGISMEGSHLYRGDKLPRIDDTDLQFHCESTTPAGVAENCSDEMDG